MIGVIADELELAGVREFFELFKSPWEVYRPGKHYDVLLSSSDQIPENGAALIVIYGSKIDAGDERHSMRTQSARGPKLFRLPGQRIPIYGNCRVLERNPDELLFHQTQRTLSTAPTCGGQQTVVRVGFDLFHEVRHLLSIGQPPEYAGTPTLELHISFLRNLIISRRLPLVEILPVPAGYRFIVCLTHDVDQPRVGYHRFDHTMFGFLYRAVVGSTVQLCRGRRSLGQLAANWKAAISLPLVFAGLITDFWDQINEYLKLEKELASTFFVIPVKGDPGIDPQGRSKTRRAASYELADIAADLEKLDCAKHEVGVHGINAWRDVTKGRIERRRVEEITGSLQLGVRMHWLYYDVQTPVALEKAGYAYDSTVGYNETIGYRAGTTQVFKPLNADRLLELPLHIMDTALFYPGYMNLSDKQAGNAVRPLIENAKSFGGVLTTNWHDRSLAPERLWSRPYCQLLDELRNNNAWFATAGGAVSWFRKRRSAAISEMTNGADSLRLKVSLTQNGDTSPGLIARVHTPKRQDNPFVDVSVHSSGTLEVSI